ncbi:MAG TPA: histidine kinase N-terminal 7TM domain-containing protein [Clostridia bacterium]|nr:histidine kinase N-terminal 7TM domain-containing protein [Clostridia bacterium]
MSLTLLVYLVLKAKRSILLKCFIFLHSMTILWVLRAAIFFVVLSFIKDTGQFETALDLLNWKLEIFVGGFIALSWLIFSLNYTGWKYAANKKVIAFLSLPTVTLFAVALTNNLHHLFMKNFVPGLFFWVHALVAYIFSLAAFVFLIRYAVQNKGPERVRSVLLIIAYLIPFLSSIINDILVQVLHSKPILGYADSSPVAFSFGTAFIALIVFKYKFLNVKTKALNNIVDNLKQSIAIVDAGNNITGFNTSFIKTFPYGSADKDGESITHLSDYLKESMDTDEDNLVIESINSSRCQSFQGVFKLVRPERRYYDVIIYPVLIKSNMFGRIISFEDITRIREFNDELEVKNKHLSLLNQELTEKNKQLHDYAAAAEELAVMRERNRISRDVHDTLGHTMTAIITQLQVAHILCGNETKLAEKIEETVSIAQNGLNELRRNISELISDKPKHYGIENEISKLAENYKAAGINIEISVNGSSKDLPQDYFEALYRLCQEAITNALRHGKAKNIDIVFNFTGNKFKAFIKDDGCGCLEINKGFGLTGMEVRINSLDGNVQYGSDGESGFNIFVELPRQTTAGMNETIPGGMK